MRTLTYQLRDLKKVNIEIGFEGENNRTQVRIDCGEVFAEYPNAEAALKVQAPKGGIYPATVTRDGDMILWTVRDSDVANKGNGEFQLTFTDGETVVKTCPGKIHVERSLKGSGTAPSGVQDWLERAEEALEQVESAEIHQPMIGLDGYWYKWDQEAQQYVSTGTKARGEDGQPGEAPIDDTEPAANKVYSSAKVEAVLTPVKNALQEISVFPESFGAKGDGSTDDSEAVQAAINAGFNIRLSDNKTYYLASEVMVKHDCHIVGGKNTVIKTKTPESGTINNAFTVEGTLKKTTALTTDYTTIGNTDNSGNRFTLEDMTGINIGDILVITAEDQYYSYARDYYYLGATLLISDIYEGHIYTSDSMPWDIENTENVKVEVYSAPVVSFENISFESELTSVGKYRYLIALKWCKNAVVKNCSMGYMANGLEIYQCINTLVDGLTVSKSKYDMAISGDGYGIYIASSTNTVIRRVLSICAASCISLSGTIPNLNTYIYNCNLFSECRPTGIGSHENSYNLVVEDCVLGGASVCGTAIFNRCRFVKNNRSSGSGTAILFSGGHNPNWSKIKVKDCTMDYALTVQISRPSPQNPVQAFDNLFGDIEIIDCVGGQLAFQPDTTQTITSNVIKHLLIENWKECYEIYHTSGNVIEFMEVINSEFTAKYWLTSHTNAVNYDDILLLIYKSNKPIRDEISAIINKNGGSIVLPENVKINFESNNQSAHYVVCGRNVASNKVDDYEVGAVSGDVGDVLTRTANAGFSTALSIDENNNIVFTQPNNTNKVYIYPKCLAFADRDCIAKMSVKLKNTGETTGSTFRPYIAIVDCKTGKITYKGIGTAGQASTDGTVITHSRVVDKNSVVMFFFYCNTPTANAETTFTEFEAELLTPGFEDEIKYKEYLGSSRNGDGYLLSIEGTNNIMANVDSFVAKVKANFID